MLTGSVQASDRYIETGSASAVPEPEGDGRRGRRDQRIEALRPERVEVALDQRPDLLGLEVVGVVVAGRQRVGPEHDPALDLGAEALAAGRQVVGEDVAVAEPRPVADPVVAGQVGRRLGRRDDVVGRQAVVGVRQADLLDDRPGRLERRDGLADARLDAGLHPGHEVLARQAEALAAERGGGLVVVAGSAVSVAGTGSGDEVESRSSRPAIAWRSAAASRTSRANGPIWSSELAKATMP